MASKSSGNGNGGRKSASKSASKNARTQPATKSAARTAGTPAQPVTKPGAQQQARARAIHGAAVDDRERALRVTQARQSLVPREGSAIPNREPARMPRADLETHVRGLGLTCQGPRGENGERTGCGFDIGELVTATPFDGREYDYTCPDCGNTGSFRAPLLEVTEKGSGDPDPSNKIDPAAQ